MEWDQPIRRQNIQRHFHTMPNLHTLAHDYDALWADYLRRIELAGASRIPSADDSQAGQKSGHSAS